MVELGEFDIRYPPRPAIKAQVLAEFITELTVGDGKCSNSAKAGERHLWKLHVDGSSTTSRSGAGLILTNPGGATWRSALRFALWASNNEAEYEALIAGLRLAKGVGASRVQAFNDSQLVMNHLKGEYEAKEPSMVRYLSKAREAATALGEFEIERIPREENMEADALAKLASSEHVVPSGTVYVEVLHSPSTEEPKEILPAEVEPSWMDPIVDYVRDGKLPESKKEARRVIGKSARYSWIDGRLYRRSFAQPYLRCLRPPEAEHALREIHEGACGNHLGGRSLAQKAVRQGYY